MPDNQIIKLLYQYKEGRYQSLFEDLDGRILMPLTAAVPFTVPVSMRNLHVS
jgi:hypothetical protein